jgi:hypothetical protein
MLYDLVYNCTYYFQNRNFKRTLKLTNITIPHIYNDLGNLFFKIWGRVKVFYKLSNYFIYVVNTTIS